MRCGIERWNAILMRTIRVNCNSDDDVVEPIVFHPHQVPPNIEEDDFENRRRPVLHSLEAVVLPGKAPLPPDI